MEIVMIITFCKHTPDDTIFHSTHCHLQIPSNFIAIKRMCGALSRISAAYVCGRVRLYQHLYYNKSLTCGLEFVDIKYVLIFC